MENTSILIWNVRGLNDRGRRDNLRKVVDDFRPSVVCLQETKLNHISERDVISFLGRDFSEFVFLPAQHTRGGILIAWRDQSFSVEHHFVHRFSVSVLLNSSTGSPWWLTGVYGPQRDEDKLSFLAELREVRSSCPGPWMIAGDFNMIYSSWSNWIGFYVPMIGKIYTQKVCCKAPLQRCLTTVLLSWAFAKGLRVREDSTLKVFGRGCLGFMKLSSNLRMHQCQLTILSSAFQSS